jgi:hypothetical protein
VGDDQHPLAVVPAGDLAQALGEPGRPVDRILAARQVVGHRILPERPHRRREARLDLVRSQPLR